MLYLTVQLVSICISDSAAPSLPFSTSLLLSADPSISREMLSPSRLQVRASPAATHAHHQRQTSAMAESQDAAHQYEWVTAPSSVWIVEQHEAVTLLTYSRWSWSWRKCDAQWDTLKVSQHLYCYISILYCVLYFKNINISCAIGSKMMIVKVIMVVMTFVHYGTEWFITSLCCCVMSLMLTSPKVMMISQVISHIITVFFCPSVIGGPIVQFKLSDIGEGIMEVTVKEWYVLTSLDLHLGLLGVRLLLFLSPWSEHR